MLQAAFRPMAAIFSTKYIISIFAHSKAKVTKSDLGIKWIKVNPGLNHLGSARVHDAAYHISWSSVYWLSRRRVFKVFTIYGHGGDVGHVTRTV